MQEATFTPQTWAKTADLVSREMEHALIATFCSAELSEDEDLIKKLTGIIMVRNLKESRKNFE